MLGKKLANLRQSLNMTQKELADMVGVSPAFISMLERGRTTASEETLTKISNIFGYPKHEKKDYKSLCELIEALIELTKIGSLKWKPYGNTFAGLVSFIGHSDDLESSYIITGGEGAEYYFELVKNNDITQSLYSVNDDDNEDVEFRLTHLFGIILSQFSHNVSVQSLVNEAETAMKKHNKKLPEED